MKNKILLSILATMVSCVSIWGQTSVGWTASNGVLYELYDNGTAEINDISDPQYFTPARIIQDDFGNNYEVNSICLGCAANATSATIPYWISKFSIGGNFPFFTSIDVEKNNIFDSFFSSEDGVLFDHDKTKLLAYPRRKTDSHYTIPSTVTTLSDEMFRDCNNLTSISIPASLTEIGRNPFMQCRNLTDIDVNVDNSKYSSENGVLYSLDKTQLLKYPEGKTASVFTIPSSVRSIWNASFRYCLNLNVINIPSSVTTIFSTSFMYCYNLTATNVDANNTIYSSENGILYNKKKTELILYPSKKTDNTFIIPSSVTYIGDAFTYCNSLQSVIIHSSVTQIQSNFFHCDNLKSIHLYNPVPPTSYSIPVLNINQDIFTLYVPFGTKETYLGNSKWNNVNIEELLAPTPTNNSVFFTWQSMENATGYKLIVYTDDTQAEIVCEIEFDANGNYVTTTSQNASPKFRSYAEGFSYEVLNLTPGATYYFTMAAYNNETEISLQEGTFSTTAEPTTVSIETPSMSSLQKAVGYYNIVGAKFPKEPERGVYIIKYDNGKTEKVVK